MTKQWHQKKIMDYSVRNWLISIGLILFFNIVIWPFLKPNIDYQVLHKKMKPPYKASFDVVVELPKGRLPNERELGNISNVLAKKVTGVETIYVNFYLPGMELDNGFFATAHHKPEMEVVLWKQYLVSYPNYHKFVPELRNDWVYDFVSEGEVAKFKK